MMKMSRPFFFAITSAVFLCGAVLHGLRVVYGFDMVYNGWVVPMWISWVATIVAFVLAFHSVRNLR